MKKIIKFIGILFIIISMLVGVNNEVFAYTAPNPMKKVEINIDGEPFIVDTDFYYRPGFTLVPMRAIFEKLGAEVTWDSEINGIIASANGRIIKLAIDSKIAEINGVEKKMSAAPQIIKGHTYIPLRFVAEALMCEIYYDDSYRGVFIDIVNTNPIREKKHLKQIVSSEQLKDFYMSVEIIDNKELKFLGIPNTADIDWSFYIDDQSKNRVGLTRANNNNEFKEYIITLQDKLKDGRYDLYVVASTKDIRLICYYGLPIEIKGGEVFFPLSPAYINNYAQQIRYSTINKDEYLKISMVNEWEKEEIVKLAEEITKDIDSDYEKIKKINDWVTQNIHYDYDAYRSGDYSNGNYGSYAYSTLVEKKAVCQGFAALTNVLIRAVGIPSRNVSGYALYGIWDTFKEIGLRPMHAWNEAFVDGRWVIIDTTWNTSNRYVDGEFREGISNYRYFDPTLEVFSYTHRTEYISK